MSGVSAARLQRRYQRLLLVYPRSYRIAHGAELVGTLMEVSQPGQSVPESREVVGLVAGGLRSRARQLTTGTAWWLDGLHLGVLLLTLGNLVTGIHHGWWSVAWPVAMALVVLATLRGWFLVALPLSALASVQVCRPMLHDLLPDAVNRLPFVGPGYGEIAPAAPHLLALQGLAILAVLTWRGRRVVRPRSWWWLAIPVLATALILVGLYPSSRPWMLAFAIMEGSLLVAAFVAAYLVRDPRWALAAGIYLTPGLIWLTSNAQTMGAFGIAYWVVLTVLSLAVLVAGVRPGRALAA
jgi:hypothetical protein